jgi:hypothetical protein
MKKKLISACLALFLLPAALSLPAARAQEIAAPPVPQVMPPPPAAPVQPLGEVVTQTPQCFIVQNAAPYTLYGTVGTDYFTDENGKKARHLQNFRLESRQRVQVCSTGPFFPEQKLELSVRTLIPILTRMVTPSGVITIDDPFKKDGSGVRESE